MSEAGIVIVMLRQPRLHDPNERRTDPLWEFGSFGCTGCHRRNLMNPKRLGELTGMRFAFAQNGGFGMKLVHVTPPVKVQNHGGVGEAKWTPPDMPLAYESAPTFVNIFDFSDFPLLTELFNDVRRSTPVAKFASKFRSRRSPLPPRVGEEIIRVFDHYRSSGATVASSYVDALPYSPPIVDHERAATYRSLLERGRAI